MSHPTFSNNRDRLTYLLAEYKLLVFGLILGVFALIWYYQPVIPSPPEEVAALAIGWIVLGPICFPAGMKIARWLHYRDWEEMFHINARDNGQTDVEKYYVPPETWREKVVDGVDPYAINGSSAWAVQEFEYLDDIGELRVKGVWLEGLQDVQLFTAKSMMIDMHGWMLDQIEKLADTRAKWSRGVVQYEKDTVNDFAEARERGVTLNRTSGRDVFEEMTGDDEEIPSLDADEMPSIDDYTTGVGSRTEEGLGEKVDRAKQQQEVMSDD